MHGHSIFAIAAAMVLASSASVVACGSSSSSDGAPPTPTGDNDAGAASKGSFTLAAPGEVEIVAGGTATLDVTASRGGAAEDIVLTVFGLPSGVTASPATIAAGQTQATITLTAAGSATQGASGKVSVTGTTASAATASAATAVFVRGAPGTLDTSFGKAGVALVPSSDVTIRAAAVQADGKIIVGGSKSGATSRTAYLLRVNASGEPDGTFGTNGAVLVDFGTSSAEEFYRVAIDASGALLANGFNFTGGTNDRILLARVDASGKLDAAFNATGKYTTTFPGGQGARSFSSVLQKDGNLVLVGTIPAGPGTWGAARVTPQGGTDATFGGGTVLPGSKPGDLWCGGQQSDGKLVLGGSIVEYVSSTYVSRWGFTRLALADGSVDTGYGTAGFAKIVWPASSDLYACALDPSDNLVAVGGLVESGTGQFVVGRYDKSASADPSFHSGAPVKLPLGAGQAQPTGVFLQSDGKIVVAGNSTAGLLTVVRLGSDGASDTTFATAGIFAASGGLSDLSNLTYSAFDRARRSVVLTGNASAGGQYGIFLARVWL